jgi:hypothetical protein
LKSQSEITIKELQKEVAHSKEAAEKVGKQVTKLENERERLQALIGEYKTSERELKVTVQ